jgi:hypothetical protein
MQVAPNRKVRLEQGKYKHSPCPTCNEPAPTRTVLASDVQLILRRRWCGDALVDFQLVLQTNDATGWRPVARFSMAHSNFHLVRTSWDPRRRVVEVIGLIDRQEQVEEAYRIAIEHAYSRIEELLRDWRAR